MLCGQGRLKVFLNYSYSFSVLLPRVFLCCRFADCLQDPAGQADQSWMDACLSPTCSIILQSPKKKTNKNCPKMFSQYEVMQFRSQPFSTVGETGDKLGKQHNEVYSSLLTTNSQLSKQTKDLAFQ